MWKRAVIIFMAFILCGAVGSAQNKRTEYEKLVDYVNCYYAKAYFDTKVKNKNDKSLSETFRKDYVDRIRPALEKVTLENTGNVSKLKSLKSYQKGKILIDFNAAKKKAFDNNWTKEQIIDYLLDLPNDKLSKDGNGFKGYLAKTTSLLKTDLQKQIPDNLFSKTEQPKKNEKDIKSDGTTREAVVEDEKLSENTETDTKKYQTVAFKNMKDEATETKKDDNSKSSGWWFWLVLGLFGGVFVWEKWLRGYFVGGNNSKNTVEQDYQNENDELKKQIKQIKTENTGQQKQTISIEQLKELVKTQKQKNPAFANFIEQLANAHLSKRDTNITAQSSNRVEQANTENSSVLYADSIIDSFFNRVTEAPNTNTIFELHLQNSQSATFIIYHSAKQRIVENPSFLEGCEKQVINNTQTIKIVSEGFAQRQIDGKWRISKKINIIIN